MTQPGPTETALLKMTRKGPIVAALIDPDDFTPKQAGETAKAAERAGCKLILVGGSTVADQKRLDSVVKSIKSQVTSKVTLFPGDITGISSFADAILFSSLLNSTNPYFLIGAQALGAPKVLKSGLEAIPMGYLVFGTSSTTSFIGQVNPLPAGKHGLAVIYALAAKYLGMRTLYLEGGSGASEPVHAETIKAVRKLYDGLLFVGGGINDAEKARKALRAGTDVLVIGNLLQTRGFEKPLREITRATKGVWKAPGGIESEKDKLMDKFIEPSADRDENWEEKGKF